MTGWQTNLNRPCITKVKEVINGKKSTTIVMEYVRRDEKSDREVYYYNNIVAEQNSTVEGKQVIQALIDNDYVSNQGHNIMVTRCELAKTATTQNPGCEQDKNGIGKQ